MYDWSFWGQGAFNTVYKSKDGKSVLKIQKNKKDLSDTPERSVRIWNEINSHLSPPARVLETRLGKGWVCPFVDGVQASDNDIFSALITLYNRTGRIVVDAPSPRNFIKTINGQIFCVDIGVALQLDLRDRHFFNGLSKNNSVVSLTAWAQNSKGYDGYFINCQPFAPNTVKLIKALLFIKAHRPDMYKVGFLKSNPNILQILAHAYDKINIALALSELNKIVTTPMILA
ncbi:MAG: hypothetical protein ACHP6H_05225, partial [Legionellales bacterium]